MIVCFIIIVVRRFIKVRARFLCSGPNDRSADLCKSSQLLLVLTLVVVCSFLVKNLRDFELLYPGDTEFGKRNDFKVDGGEEGFVALALLDAGTFIGDECG